LGVLTAGFRLPSHFAVILVVFVAITILPAAMAPIAPKVDLVLRVPRGYAFDDITVIIASGSVISTASLSTRSVDLNLCGTKFRFGRLGLSPMKIPPRDRLNPKPNGPTQ
jgi:hypothetical protein